MGRFAKLWGSIVGGLVGVIFGVLASAGLATCSNEALVETCTVLGFSTTQVTAALAMLGSAIFTYLFPANE